MSTSETTASLKWRRRSDARPAEILAAALASFAEHGFAATRLDEVAARAGVTKGTLYLYFRSKEELFKAVVRQELVPNIERAEAMLAQSSASSLALLGQLVALMSEIMASPLSAIPKLVLTEAGNFPDLARFYAEEVVDRGKALVRRVLERGVAAGEIRAIDAESAVLCVIAPLLLAALWRHSFERHAGRRLDIEALCRTHFDLLQRGLATTAPSPEPPPEPLSEPRGAGVVE
jgi:AcrR family transcriptional regulator